MTKNISVLVVDDCPVIKTLLNFALSAAGIQVVEAEDGACALEVLNSIRPDLVLTDLNMPRLDGYGLIRAIRADPLLASLPVVVLSSESPPAQSQIEQLGICGWLTKPFDPDLLAEALYQFDRARPHAAMAA